MMCDVENEEVVSIPNQQSVITDTVKDNHIKVDEKSSLIATSKEKAPTKSDNVESFCHKLGKYMPVIRLGAISTLSYFLGFLQWSVLFILIPICIFVIYINKKYLKRRKSVFAADVQTLGEEKALKCRFSELPSWVQFSDVDRVEWLNRIIGIMWPHISYFTDQFLRQNVEPLARETLEQYKLWGFKFERIDFGKIPLRLGGVKVHGRTQYNASEIILDVDFEYNGDIDVSISIMKIVASLADVQIEGKLRIVLKPLIEDVPFIAGIQIYFLTPPQIDFDLGGAASIMDLPGLNSLLKDAINDNIENSMVLPNKISVMLSDKISPVDLKMPHPVGIITVEVVEARNLPSNLDMLSSIDPYVIVRHGSFELQTSVKSGSYPVWNEKLIFPIEVPEYQELNLLIFDKDMSSSDDFSGSTSIDIQSVIKNGRIDAWISLDNVTSGQIHLRLFWSPVKEYVEDNASELSALLCIFLDSVEVGPRYSSRPNLRTKIKCEENSQETQNFFQGEKNPKFHEGFVFTLDGYNESSKVKFSVIDDRREVIVASGNFIISKIILGDSRQESKLFTYKLNDGETTITFAAQLKYLDKLYMTKFSESVSALLTSGSKRLVKGIGIGATGAAREVSGYAKNVGSATGTAIKHLGSAAYKSKRRIIPASVKGKPPGEFEDIPETTPSLASIKEIEPKVEQEMKPSDTVKKFYHSSLKSARKMSLF